METVLEGALKARPGCGLVNGPHTVGWAGLGDDEQRGSAHVVVGSWKRSCPDTPVPRKELLGLFCFLLFGHIVQPVGP